MSMSSNISNLIKIENVTTSVEYVWKMPRCTVYSSLPPMNRNPISVKPTPKRIATKLLYESGHIDNDNANRICPFHGLTIRLLILVTSKLSHAAARLAIRQTWGTKSRKNKIALAFVVGRSLNEKLNEALKLENDVHHDLIQGRFVDSYNNLTLKTISLLEWVDQNCQRPLFIMKTDDDVFINIPNLLNFLDRIEDQDKTRSIFGRLLKNKYPVRQRLSKYFVSSNEFSNQYPAFIAGPAYLMTRDIIHELYSKSLETDYLKLEDVFITGIVAESLGIERLDEVQFLNQRIFFLYDRLIKVISTHHITPKEQYILWALLLENYRKQIF